MVALAAGTVFSASALAQPAVFTDLGAIDPVEGATVTQSGFSTTTSGATSVVWFRFNLTAPTTYDNLRFLNVWNVGTGDTAITIFNNVGNIVAEDDDDGPGLQSSLSFGSGDGQFPNGGTGTPAIGNGRDLDLPAGTYWIGVAHYLNDPAAGWTFETTTQTATGPWDLNVGAGVVTVPSPTVTFTDLGTLGVNATVNLAEQAIGAGEVKWFRVVLPNIARSQGSYLDIDTEGSVLAPTNATRLSIYSKLGAFMGFADTIDGTGSLSQLTFGLDNPARPALGGLPYNGRDGAIVRAGEYYIAVAAPGSAPSITGFSGQFWGHTSTSSNAGTFNLNIVTASVAVPATGIGSAVTIVEGATGVLRVTTAPGNNPVSSVSSVVIDASGIGGSSNLVLLDNGTNGDTVAGDGVYSSNITVTVPQQPVVQLPFTVTDSIGRISTGNLAATIGASPSGACCTGTTCAITRQFLCTTGGGTFAGAGTDCGGVQTYSFAAGSGTFTSIAATGTPISFTTSTGGAVDDANTVVSLPFDFNFFGTTYNTIGVVSNGFAQFTGTATTFGNSAIPGTAAPNNALYPFWDDFAFVPDATTGVFTQVDGTAPNRTFTISWENVGQYSFATVVTPVGSNSFQVVLTEGTNGIEFRYGAVDALNAPLPIASDPVTIGIENAAGTVAATVDSALIGSGSIAYVANFTTSPNPCEATGCDDIDFNNDEVFPDDQDVIDFFNVLAGGDCPACNDIDFNNDDVFPDDQDVIDFFNVLAGGECP